MIDWILILIHLVLTGISYNNVRNRKVKKTTFDAQWADNKSFFN